MKTMTMILTVAGIFSPSARGQGFLNLDFESAYGLPGNPGNGELVSVTNALPDWIAYDGGLALSQAYYASNIIYGPEASVGLDGGSLALNGNFSVGLYNGGAIGQTAQVPDNAESLLFEAQGLGVPDASGFFVTLGGQTLSYSLLSQGPNYDVWGANIPAEMEGQTETLVLGCEGVGSGGVVLDNIEFSTMGVPEPAEWALVGLGLILVGVGLRCRHRQARPLN